MEKFSSVFREYETVTLARNGLADIVKNLQSVFCRYSPYQSIKYTFGFWKYFSCYACKHPLFLFQQWLDYLIMLLTCSCGLCNQRQFNIFRTIFFLLKNWRFPRFPETCVGGLVAETGLNPKLICIKLKFVLKWSNISIIKDSKTPLPQVLSVFVYLKKKGTT